MSVHVTDVFHHLPHTPAADWLFEHLYDTDLAPIGELGTSALAVLADAILITAYEADHHLRRDDIVETLRLLSIEIGI